MRRRRTDQAFPMWAWVAAVAVTCLIAAGGTSLFIMTRADVTHLSMRAQDADAHIGMLENQIRDMGGTPGQDGRDGETIVGRDGEDGRDGADGMTVVGPTGPAGETGQPGPQGPQGATGPAGPQGPAGRDGVNGRDGRDAAPPASFTFVAGLTRYTCTDANGDTAYECQQEGIG